MKVEGGREYGTKWQQRLQDCRAIQFPGFPGPGCGWFQEAALGTDPWRARALDFADYGHEASWERGRTGVIHWGLGGRGHWHIHTYCNTMDFTLNDGKQFRLIDKGHLTLLDDPEIRKIAAKYGDPDEILKEKWIPAVPGVNVPGNYLTDYAQDPWKVFAGQQAEKKQKMQAARSRASL